MMFIRYYKSILLAVLTVLIAGNCLAKKKARLTVELNRNWAFKKGGQNLPAGLRQSAKVNFPHTWNAVDVMDDTPGYYRGAGWYLKKIALRPEWKNKKIYLEFEGANQVTTVFINGKIIGEHNGGYTAFRFALSNLKYDGTDEIIVKVDNSFNENIPPLTADFTFFGGIYRNVSLSILSPTHFDDNKFASSGIFIRGDHVTSKGANVLVRGELKNSSIHSNFKVIASLSDTQGRKIGEKQINVTAKKDRTVSFSIPSIAVPNPNLWSPEKPYLYQVTTKIVTTATGEVLDELKTAIGLRYFTFDAEKGFFLNGKPYKLIGASRHQDYAGKGNAVPKGLQVKDVEHLKEMGGNFLRVAHYPQDQSVLDACDRLGILAAVEIPIVNEITESEGFYANCKNMQLEMIRQNYNHPSIMIWAYMNEVLLRTKYNSDPDRKNKYLASIQSLAQQLEDLTRQADPTRYTMMSNHGDVNAYVKAGLTKIPMLVGWNLYQGWYGGKSEDFGPGLDRIHQQIPDKPMLVTEFGADADPRIHSFKPVRFDKSVEYAMLYHQIYIKDILKRPFVAGAAVWNLSDFNSETRDETMPHINNKGLLTLDRRPKNTYFLYKANFQQKPFIKIADGVWRLRAGIASSEQPFQQNLQVITNSDSVELFVNGTSYGKKIVVDRLANWSVPFQNGSNHIRAVAKVKGSIVEDRCILNFEIQPFNLKDPQSPFKSLNVLLGAQRQFVDEQRQEVWLPSQNYIPGSWGSIGGDVFKIKNGRQSYGTDKNIHGTTNDPIYQTQLEGIEAYQIDVPNGSYKVTLHFAELVGNANQSFLPYNLDSLKAVSKEDVPQRIFDVYLNDELVIKNLNLAASYGVAKAVQREFNCAVTDEKGIKLQFKNHEGKAVLNGLQVKRIN